MSYALRNKFKISRRGRKLHISDDTRTLIALPKDVPERTWAEIMQKEENDLVIFDIREEILEDAIKIVYAKYMERQTALFTAHCAAQAWLKLINWQFYRHDPGEECSAQPACHIPKREESWAADAAPAPSPRDTWCRRRLPVLDACEAEDVPQRWPSADSLDLPPVADIPQECRFPGKVCLPRDDESASGGFQRVESISSFESGPASGELGADSELLQRVTDYSDTELSEQSTYSALKRTTPVAEADARSPAGAGGDAGDAGDAGAGDAARPLTRRKSKSFSKHSILWRSRAGLAPQTQDSRSKLSFISDCRLRNLRLDTQYEVSSEKVDTPPGETVKRK